MTTTMNPKVDFFFNKADKWQAEFDKLRMIALDCGLVEELKWGCPCYILPTSEPFGKASRSSQKSNNVVLIHGFKEYCAFLFFKGVLMHDPAGLLIQQTENVQSARQIRFTSVDEINSREPMLKDYIREAIKVEKAGLKVELKKVSQYSVPNELQHKFNAIPQFETAFNALTPGRQRAYLLHFSQPKQSTTRQSRIEKAMPNIFSGKGLND
ncbi:MAG: hypothetical protein K0S09_1372 [Sphingobacteriaceae bacterium]|jgi:uncharacterized protein YdeI (YjbR/CyaY-like superfamily)|nr:hypothetical protein [Sphingobacteriaceae bacterium]